MLSEFIAQVKSTGFANSNKFIVDISPPATVSVTGDTSRMIQLFCDTCQLPDQTISTTQTRTYGEIREMPYENLYGNITMSFYVDSDFHVKYFFDNWIQSIANTETRHWEYYTYYVSGIITVTMLNNAGDPCYRVNLYECYPKSIQSIQLDYGSKDVVKCTVSMNYKYWRAETIEASHAPPTAAVQVEDQAKYGTETTPFGGDLDPTQLGNSNSGTPGYPIPGFPESTALPAKINNPLDGIDKEKIKKVTDIVSRVGGFAGTEGAIRYGEGKIQNAVSAVKQQISKATRLPGGMVDEITNKLPSINSIKNKINDFF